MTELRTQIAKQVYLLLCGVPDEIDTEWLTCGENMQQNCLAIADEILKLIEAQYQPVQLEVLTDEEMFEIYSTEGLDDLCFVISQATNRHNLKVNGGQVFRRIE